MVPLLQRVTFGRAPKVTKSALPHHSAPRLGSVCPHSGIAPWAAAKGHPWPSAATSASMPRCPLRNACVRPSWLTGRRDQRPPRGGLIADLVLGGTAFPLWERACSRRGRSSQHLQRMCHRLREQTRSHTVGLKHSRQRQVGYQAASFLILIWGAPLTTLAERRHCAVGIPAWMPG